MDGSIKEKNYSVNLLKEEFIEDHHDETLHLGEYASFSSETEKERESEPLLDVFLLFLLLFHSGP
jgi:hypothetical protein